MYKEKVTGPRIMPDRLKDFTTKVFVKMGVTPEDAAIVADVLVAADIRGVRSHGTARMHLYITRLEKGIMKPVSEIKVVAETLATARIDGGAGMGQPISKYAMNLAMEKAQNVGAGFVTVFNSNHYGIAGYYAMMALEHDMIGFSMTNASAISIPTFGIDGKLGTNPISVAAPAGDSYPYVLDMATTITPVGRIEVYERNNWELPEGWAIDEHGQPITEPTQVFETFRKRASGLTGGLLPLGGAGEMFGGYKGYGLALLVDILCGVLSGAGYADNFTRTNPDGSQQFGNIGHFFGALRVDAFRPIEDFKETMDDLICRIKATPKAEGQDRIYIHGEKEFEAAADNEKNGVVLIPPVLESLKDISEKFNVPFDFTG
ncbi:MAG: Ldh family oxidoreductase [Anaerolineae bacterium]|nr:Ldh family oxidoreductase [Anaerolineae bacterium]